MNTFLGFSQVSFAAGGDSSQYAPLKPSSVTPQYPGQNVTAQPIVNTQYCTLPVCPGQTGGAPLCSTSASPYSSVICPNINGVYPSGGSANTCPNVCTVTRQVTQKTVGSVTQVTSTTDAVCPAGYAQVAHFNPQQEIAQNNNPPYASYPMDMSTYNSYSSAGYSCNLYAPSNNDDNECHNADHSANDYFTLNKTESINGYAGQYTSNKESGCYYSGNGCNNKVCSGCTCSPESWYDRIYTGYFSYFQCKPPAGLFYTTNSVPVSLVCARVKSEWKASQ